MKKFAFAFAALLAFSLVGANAESAAADGFSIHIGRPAHGYRTGHLSHRYRAYYGRPYQSYYGWRSHYYPHHGHRHVWHDTSHWDYHPGEFIWHGDHFDYVPGHLHFHEEGHWDHVPW